MSYDYDYLKISLPLVYDFLDEIILCIDKNRQTWSGETFEVNGSFWKWLEAFDKRKKISVYEDFFFIPELSTMQCETRERHMLAQRMGECDWYIQIDSDEYFLDFRAFINRLNKQDTSKPVTIRCRVAPLFKQTAKGFLVIDTETETLPFATNIPEYLSGRASDSATHQNLVWDDLVLHQSWARSESEIQTKLNSWGHKDDFNTASFFNLWNAIDENNYSYLKDFHPLDRVTWCKLVLIENKGIDQILSDPAEILKTLEKKGNRSKIRWWSLLQ